MRRIVIFLSRSDASVLVDIIAGTEQPKPISIGTKLLPERPIFLSSLSITNAILAIYPLSSRIDKKKNNTTITGRNDRTLPTPANIPSITSECTTGLIPNAVSPASHTPVNQSIAMLSRSESPAPITPNVSQKTSAIIPAKAGSAVYFPVRKRSIFTLLACALLSTGFTTVLEQTFSIKLKRISASAASRSLPHSFSISEMICSRSSFSFSSSASWVIISLSPSISFVAANLTGIFAFAAWSSIRCTTACIPRCTAARPFSALASQKSSLPGHSSYLATCTACSISSFIPSFFAAEIGTTGIPSVFSSSLILIVPPFSLTSSIILSASTIGISISISCIVR